MNRYPLWKYLLILVVLAFSLIYALPNRYVPDPAIQISGQSTALKIDDKVLATAAAALDQAGIEHFGGEVKDGNALIRLRHLEQQMLAKRIIQEALGHDFVVALNLASTTPAWLNALGATPMKLGLDLSGGVHFLLEVDTESAINKRMEAAHRELRTALREEKVRYKTVRLNRDNTIVAVFTSEQERNQAATVLRSRFNDLSRTLSLNDQGEYLMTITMTDAAVRDIVDYAVKQNLATLRNRVNELGVSEPIVQRQGSGRIVVELPGVQDTAEAKRIIGKTANLEFRLEAEPGTITGREQYEFRDGSGMTALLESKAVITGDSVTGAQAAFDENGFPQVNIRLDADGGAKMHRMTRKNVGRRLGVLFIEYKTRSESRQNAAGEVEVVPVQYAEKKIISLATIQSALGVSFRITGLNSPAEASELALLLRAGALAAPMYFVEERTIGPSLGAENIEQGVKSGIIGTVLVLIFMLLCYRLFGLFTNIALCFNVVILMAIMSLIGATLTLPGIAGIVLTVGMAVDANVLICSRIKEELKKGMSPQAAISAGYDRAFVSILDANLTTLIVAIILYAVGSGPVLGFAVTLAIGIATSMFTSIIGTRALTNLVYGGRNVKKLWI